MTPRKLRIPRALVWTAVGPAAVGVSLACSSARAPESVTACDESPDASVAMKAEADACAASSSASSEILIV